MAWKFMSVIMSLLGCGAVLLRGWQHFIFWEGTNRHVHVTLVRVRSESEEVFTNPLCEEEVVIQITSALCNPSESSHSI